MFYSTKVVIGPVDHDYVLDPETHEYRCKYCGLYGGKEYNMTDVENVVTAMAHISASLPDYEVLFKFNKAD